MDHDHGKSYLNTFPGIVGSINIHLIYTEMRKQNNFILHKNNFILHKNNFILHENNFFQSFKKKTNKSGICLSHNPLQIL